MAKKFGNSPSNSYLCTMITKFELLATKNLLKEIFMDSTIAPIIESEKITAISMKVLISPAIEGDCTIVAKSNDTFVVTCSVKCNHFTSKITEEKGSFENYFLALKFAIGNFTDNPESVKLIEQFYALVHGTPLLEGKPYPQGSYIVTVPIC